MESRKGFHLLIRPALSGSRAQRAKEWQEDKINGCRESVVCLQEEGRVNWKEECQIRRGRLQCGPGAQQGLAFQALLPSFLLLPPSCFPSSFLLLSPFSFSPRSQMEVCRLKTQIPLLRSVTPACWSWSSEKPGAHADNTHKVWHKKGA